MCNIDMKPQWSLQSRRWWRLGEGACWTLLVKIGWRWGGGGRAEITVRLRWERMTVWELELEEAEG